ncbi:hypothetical protein T01_10365, partial [Trichinella spiralis]
MQNDCMIALSNERRLKSMNQNSGCSSLLYFEPAAFLGRKILSDNNYSRNEICLLHPVREFSMENFISYFSTIYETQVTSFLIEFIDTSTVFNTDILLKNVKIAVQKNTLSAFITECSKAGGCRKTEMIRSVVLNHPSGRAFLPAMIIDRVKACMLFK